MEKVLSGAATPPASAVPNTAERNSGRLVISTPTRSPLPRPPAASALATATLRSQRSRYDQRSTPPSGRWKTSASRSAKRAVTSRRKPGSVSSPSPASAASGGPRTIETDASRTY